MANFDFTGDHIKDFIGLLEKIANGGSRSKVFNDFLTLAATAISNPADLDFTCNSKEVWQAREKLYIDTITKYDKDCQVMLIDMLVEFMLACEECISVKILRDLILRLDYKIHTDRKPHYFDLMGKIFHQLDLNDQKDGQVFTPQHVADLMGYTGITKESAQRDLDSQGFVCIKENCCGSSALALGGLNSLLELNISPNHQALCIVADTDERCVLMSYIQLSVYMIPAVVMQQNAITDEIYSPLWFTPMFIKHKWMDKFNPIFEKMRTDYKEKLEAEAEEEVKDSEPKAKEIGQMSLF